MLVSSVLPLSIFAADSKPQTAAVSEEELQRAPRAPVKGFPWHNKPADPKTRPAVETKTDAGAMPDMTSGDIIIYGTGVFTREVKRLANSKGIYAEKEVLTLTKDVEIEHLQTQSVLRGQRIRVVRDLKTSSTELLEAQGSVELVTPERQGRGEFLQYETEFGPNGEVLKDLYTLEGDRKGGKATLWQGDDRIEAEKFISDRRMDRFRVQGGPTAIVTLKAQAAPPKSDTPRAAGGLVPWAGVGMGAAGRIRLQADGEMDYDGASGRMTITRNVVIEQQNDKGQISGRMIADRAQIVLLLPPPGQPQASKSMFTGALRSLECNGRVEIIAPAQTILCDRAMLDMPRNLFVMAMENQKEAVRIYIRDVDESGVPQDGGKVLLAPKSLRVSMETSEFEAGGPQRMESFTGPVPSPRAAKK